MSLSRSGRLFGLTLAGLLGASGLVVTGGGSAVAAPGVVRADRAVERSCAAAPLSGAAGTATRELTADATGIVQARLTGGGDWDVAVFDAATGRSVAASAGFTSNELAEGFVTQGQRLLVQTCRYAGSSATVALTTDVLPVAPAAAGGTSQLVSVQTPDRAAERRLLALGLDVTEHGTRTTLDVVVKGEADLKALRDAGLAFTVVIADLGARAAQYRAEDQTYAAAAARSPLPSGRTSYRRLADYQLEMKQLARRFPDLVKPLTLPYRTVEGRDVNGIEISRQAGRVADGKPVFLLMGLHHAREWPSGENAMEFAYDLLTNGDFAERNTRLLSSTRTVIVPVVNPDGFTISREAEPIGDFSLFDYENKRKNCNAAPAPFAYRGGTCADNPAGRLRGTDLNRNYGGFWGGNGASPLWSSDTFRGAAPFGEPETKNIQSLVSSRQVTTLISNHTYSNLVLRTPGQYDTQPPKDAPLYQELGARLTAHNGYSNDLSYNLYETTGTTEDWSYWNTGGLGFTFEIGDQDFHPAFRNAVVGEYLGRPGSAGAGKGGNREAYYAMLEATANKALHSTLTGTAPAGWTLRVHKEFMTPTSPVVQFDGTTRRPQRYKDTLDTTYRSDGGSFTWAVNPSTRPYVDGRQGRDAQGPPQVDLALRNPAGVPAVNQGDPLTGAREQIPFTVKGPPQVDNGRLDVRIQWASAATDWDLYILDEQGEVVASSAAGGTTFENAVLLDPPPGRYTAVIVNYEGGAANDWGAGTVDFSSPDPATPGKTESWLLTCERPGGAVATVRKVVVARGETADLGDVCRPKQG